MKRTLTLILYNLVSPIFCIILYCIGIVPLPTQAVLIGADNNIQETMEAPGAMVEVIATNSTPTSVTNLNVSNKRNVRKKSATPSYREELLLK